MNTPVISHKRLVNVAELAEQCKYQLLAAFILASGTIYLRVQAVEEKTPPTFVKISSGEVAKFYDGVLPRPAEEFLKTVKVFRREQYTGYHVLVSTEWPVAHVHDGASA